MSKGMGRVADNRWMMLWGAMDLAALLLYAVSSVYQGGIPVAHDIASGMAIQQRHGSMLPLLVSILDATLLLSMLLSGILLVKRYRLGRYVVIAQLPFRILLVMPSVFFLAHMGWAGFSPALLMVLMALGELLKLWSLWGKRRRSDGSGRDGGSGQ
ncbi:hypothetical protein ABRP17_006050 [Stenotrophomonas sp. WHRI 8082]|uniref:hypothetical protein n=1 Tax=Stenotrophomonas sp. WHRI 8082 TaxID=3162571 RepID=UPI0032EC1E32